MMATSEDITAGRLVSAYDAIVSLGGSGSLAALAAEMRKDFQKRTGSFRPEDPWFEARSRAFWDDALTFQQFAAAAEHALGTSFARAHRGLFVVEERSPKGALLVDLWSGAELLVNHWDETQALALEHADAPFDGRVVAGSDALFVLPGAYHHPPDALTEVLRVLDEARTRKLGTGATLDALLRMELVLRASSRVKPGFAYRPSSLPQST